MGFRLVPKSVTLNYLERRNGRYFALFGDVVSNALPGTVFCTIRIHAAYYDRRSWEVCLSVCLSVAIVIPTKTAEPIIMAFGIWIQEDQGTM